MPHQVTYDVVATPIRPRVELAAVSNASSGHLRRCSDADTTKQCLSRENNASILSWPAMMAHYKLLIVVFTVRDPICC
eukprot:scaffold22512_cov98-Skeletonema_marinoi.AAC.4